ncbi:MAG: class I SAM-dependent methyltransferase [Solirubrobacterales bacterium]
MSVAAIWHDVECGSYAADLALWEELAEAAGGPVLELGCGTGRVALHLARRGHAVVGLDVDPELVAALAERAQGLPVGAIAADARDFSLATDVALALAPMQFLQLLAGSAERIACLRRVAACLVPGGRMAAAIVERIPEADGAPPPLPDVRDVDGWVYSSLPVEAAIVPGEIVLRRLRQTVSPTGGLSEERNEIRIHTFSAEQLEAEAAEAGLTAVERRAIPPTDIHVGSTVVILEKGP